MTHRDLDAVLRHAVILGTLAVLLIPGARGSSEWLGWLPLWLMAMPLAAWWSLRGFPVPRRAFESIAQGTPRRAHAQALRRPRARRAARLAKAA